LGASAIGDEPADRGRWQGRLVEGYARRSLDGITVAIGRHGTLLGEPQEGPPGQGP